VVAFGLFYIAAGVYTVCCFVLIRTACCRPVSGGMVKETRRAARDKALAAAAATDKTDSHRSSPPHPPHRSQEALYRNPSNASTSTPRQQCPSVAVTPSYREVPPLSLGPKAEPVVAAVAERNAQGVFPVSVDGSQ
jgi:hypothetical protein